MKSILRSVTVLLAFIMAVTPVLGGVGGVSFAEDKVKYTFGRCEVCSTFGPGMLDDSFYCSDSWFEEEPEKENDELALLSMQAVSSFMDDKDDGSGAEFLKKLGFTDIGFYGVKSDDPDDCAYMYGKKKIGDETLIAVMIQSYSLTGDNKLKGWKQNFTVNGDVAKGEHEGLRKAAESVLGKIAALSEGEENVRYWISGHSRGGAIANLISAKLPKALGRKSSIYAYTFESPAVVDKEMIESPEEYGYIHNYCCSDDIVTMVPPEKWGMTVYGTRRELKTSETDALLNDELMKLGSKARLADESMLGIYDAEYIIGQLLTRIPDRKAYTEKVADPFTMPDGTKVNPGTPQETFVKLMDLIFGEDKIELAGLSDRIGEAAPLIEPVVRAYMIETGKIEGDEYDANCLYYTAAEGLVSFLAPEEGELPLSARDAFAVLKLAAPVLLDPDALDEPLTSENALKCITPALVIVMGKDDLVFSHHFDTCLGRLKALAPAPALTGIDLVIPAPSAGAAVSKSPRDAEKAAGDLGFQWLDASAKWETEDPVLENNKVYYLNVTYYIEGHSIPEDAKFTLNGSAPAGKMKVSHKDGVTTVRLAYQFKFGTPSEHEVSFEGEIVDSPESMMLPVGTMLKYVDCPVPEDVEGYRLGGWYISEDHIDWEDVTVGDEDIYVYPFWIKLIDRVEISFTAPQVGSGWKMPSVPKNAPYHIEGALVTNDDDEEVEKILKKEALKLKFTVVPNSKKYAFDEVDDELTGGISVKGADLDYSYFDYEMNLFVECMFTPKDNKVTALKKGGDYKMADKVIRSSKSDKSLKGSSKSPLKLKAGKKTKKSVKLSWKKVKGARKYVVYGALKGKKFRKIKSLSKSSFNVRKLAKEKRYKFIVVAVTGNMVVSTSRTVSAKTKR